MMNFKSGCLRFISVTLICCIAVPGRAAGFDLPATDRLLAMSDAWSTPLMKGVRFNPADPLNLEFVFDAAHQRTISKEEVKKLVEYFLAGLTVPEEDLWVNLSPYESDRITTDAMAVTDMGVDMLGQDYILKQLSSSLTYPETPTGEAYWREHSAGEASSELNAERQAFSKIWIVPDSATMYESDSGTSAFVINAALKAMTEADYLAIQENRDNAGRDVARYVSTKTDAASGMAALLPVVTRELNEGRNFATLRQIHHSLLLAMWFKAKFRETFFSSYFNAAKTAGIDTEDPAAREKIFNLYCEAFSKGVFNYDRKERDVTGRLIKRHYFSGGVNAASALETVTFTDNKQAVYYGFSGDEAFVCSALLSGSSSRERIKELIYDKVDLLLDDDPVIQATGREWFETANRRIIDILLDMLKRDYWVAEPALSQVEVDPESLHIAYIRAAQYGDPNARRHAFVRLAAMDDPLVQEALPALRGDTRLIGLRDLTPKRLFCLSLMTIVLGLNTVMTEYMTVPEMARENLKLARSFVQMDSAAAAGHFYDEVMRIVEVLNKIETDERSPERITSRDIRKVQASHREMVRAAIVSLERLAEVCSPDNRDFLRSLIDGFRQKPYLLTPEEEERLTVMWEKLTQLGGISMRGTASAAITPYTGTVRTPTDFDPAGFEGMSVVEVSRLRSVPVESLGE